MFATAKQLSYLNALIGQSEYADLHAVKTAYYGVGRIPASDMTVGDVSELIDFLKSGAAPEASAPAAFELGDAVLFQGRLGKFIFSLSDGRSSVKFDGEAEFVETAALTAA